MISWFNEATEEKAPEGGPFEIYPGRSELLSIKEIPKVLSELWAEEENLPWLIN